MNRVEAELRSEIEMKDKEIADLKACLEHVCEDCPLSAAETARHRNGVQV